MGGRHYARQAQEAAMAARPLRVPPPIRDVLRVDPLGREAALTVLQFLRDEGYQITWNGHDMTDEDALADEFAAAMTTSRPERSTDA